MAPVLYATFKVGEIIDYGKYLAVVVEVDGDTAYIYAIEQDASPAADPVYKTVLPMEISAIKNLKGTGLIAYPDTVAYLAELGRKIERTIEVTRRRP